MNQRRRAMRDDQKQVRRQAMIDIAWQLFQGTPYPAITIAEVAERAGLAKGTVYLYFRTKEELFLTVQQQQFATWFDDLDTRLAEVHGAASSARVAEIICTSLDQHGALVQLLAILHTVLEHNIDLETALRFKRMLLERIRRTGALLEGCLPFLSAGQGPETLLQIYALIIGVEHVASPAPVVREALQLPELRIFDISFGPTFAAILMALLRGLEHAASD
jgi:AcrR family transcriptional regulator